MQTNLWDLRALSGEPGAGLKLVDLEGTWSTGALFRYFPRAMRAAFMERAVMQHCLQKRLPLFSHALGR